MKIWRVRPFDRGQVSALPLAGDVRPASRSRAASRAPSRRSISLQARWFQALQARPWRPDRSRRRGGDQEVKVMGTNLGDRDPPIGKRIAEQRFIPVLVPAPRPRSGIPARSRENEDSD